MKRPGAAAPGQVGVVAKPVSPAVMSAAEALVPSPAAADPADPSGGTPAGSTTSTERSGRRPPRPTIVWVTLGVSPSANAVSYVGHPQLRSPRSLWKALSAERIDSPIRPSSAPGGKPAEASARCIARSSRPCSGSASSNVVTSAAGSKVAITRMAPAASVCAARGKTGSNASPAVASGNLHEVSVRNILYHR